MWPRRLGVTVGLGRMWGVRSNMVNYDLRVREEMPTGMLVRGGRRCHEPNYRAVLGCMEGTTPSGNWIRRRRRRATERRRTGKSRIELSLKLDFLYSDQCRKLREAFYSWDRREGEPARIEWQREHVTRSGPSGLLR